MLGKKRKWNNSLLSAQLEPEKAEKSGQQRYKQRE